MWVGEAIGIQNTQKNTVKFSIAGSMGVSQMTFYERLGGYDAMMAATNDLLPCLQEDP